MRPHDKSIDGRMSHLLNRVPSHRPLPEEAWEIVRTMTVDERGRLAFSADALIDNLTAHVRELKKIKQAAETKPELRSL